MFVGRGGAVEHYSNNLSRDVPPRDPVCRGREESARESWYRDVVEASMGGTEPGMLPRPTRPLAGTVGPWPRSWARAVYHRFRKADPVQPLTFAGRVAGANPYRKNTALEISIVGITSLPVLKLY